MLLFLHSIKWQEFSVDEKHFLLIQLDLYTYRYSYQSMFGMNIMSHENFIFKFFINQILNHGNSLCITWVINPGFELKVRIFYAKKIKLTKGTKFRCKFCQLFMILYCSWSNSDKVSRKRAKIKCVLVSPYLLYRKCHLKKSFYRS